ncbi:MAG: hypothetical protein WCO71_11645, partial [Pseudomonadota bacterium]
MPSLASLWGGLVYNNQETPPINRESGSKVMPKFFLILISTATLALVLSCGKKDEKDGNGNGAPPPVGLSPFEQITGDWTGIYAALSDGKPIGNWLPISANFHGDGNFILRLENDDTAVVSGEWSQFQGASMIWKIGESTISPIGVKKQVVQPNFALEGSSLRINSEGFEIRLPGKRNNDTPQDGPMSESLGTGSWNCEAAGRQSKVVLDENHEFRLSSVSQGERAFVARGASSLTSDSIMTLTPRFVSDALPEGSYFELRQTARNIDLFFIKSTAKESPRRQPCRDPRR